MQIRTAKEKLHRDSAKKGNAIPHYASEQKGSVILVAIMGNNSSLVSHERDAAILALVLIYQGRCVMIVSTHPSLVHGKPIFFISTASCRI
jgi:hypothetical protein